MWILFMCVLGFMPSNADGPLCETSLRSRPDTRPTSRWEATRQRRRELHRLYRRRAHLRAL